MPNYPGPYSGAQIDAGIAGGLIAVSYDAQDKTDAQKTQARTNIGAAESELFSRNGTVALPSGYKGIDVRPFSDGISLGIGKTAPATSGNVDVADSLKASFLSAIGAWGEPVLLWGGGDALWTDGTQTIPNVRDYNYFYFQVSGSTGVILSGGRIITTSGEIYVNVGAFLISGDTVNSRNICITASANSDVCSIYKRFLASHLSSSGHSNYSSQDVMSIYAIYGVKI